MSLKGKKKGFTIIEVLVALVIVALVSISMIGMQSSFSKSTNNRMVSTALSDVAQSVLLLAKSSSSIPTYIEYTLPSTSSDTTKHTKMKVYIETVPNPLPAISSLAADTCTDIVIRTSDVDFSKVLVSRKKFTLETNLCNFN